ncbi:Cytoplasmic thioredoxin isoenzyme 2 [Mortierella alpina]|uniref:Thioredoxin n=1 Tax=Mortierella alpina TaxID=64518 RepID=A0A9P6IXM8_MORAP|nr:Cytoplasmic thioredoxin isoenzyme 2 [Mortierella alpina]
MIKQVESREEFDKVLASHDKVVIQFTAVWCSHCKAIAPKLTEYDQDFEDITFIKVDIDDLPEVSQDAGIRAMPTIHFIYQGQRSDELVGADNTKLIQQINALAAKFEP